MPLHVQLIEHNSPAYHDTVKLRDEILRKPLGLNLDPGELDKESSLFHIACYIDKGLAGCLILQPDGSDSLKMRQVAVSQKHQGTGVGRAMVEFSEQFARERGFKRITMHARDTAVPFYLKLGYSIEGEPFEEVTIPHRSMFKSI
ncbi:MAG TPA: GNAT family N-acetyltransferase [Candidatus Obscuribacterales bacterium]